MAYNIKIKEIIHNNLPCSKTIIWDIISAAKRPEFSAKLNNWLSNHYSGSMKWMERAPEWRCDPKALMPEAKSVICFGFAYGENGLVDDNSSPKAYDPMRARFARGQEYHKFVRKKLKKICAELKKNYPQARFKICVDTSPILEKALAAKAGLGWIGKNTLLINPKFGSYLVLGEIITDIPLDCFVANAPRNDIGQCGDCNKCIEACPTNALVAPYVLDARRCLAYLTVEHKGEVPKEFKKFIKPGQYGCDICQQVCPYNSHTNSNF